MSGAGCVWLNRGKESVVLDIKAAEDKALLEQLIAKADVFIQNLAPGAMARAGFASAALRERHPRLITVDISGYGEEGEYAGMKAYDLLVQAESGLASVTGHPAGLGRVGVSVCDIACGMNAHAAVLEALLARSVTGRGQGISVSLFDGMADWMNVPLLYFEGTGRSPERLGLAHPSICPYGAFETADGALVLISVQNEREWADLCGKFLDQPDLALRKGFRSNVERVGSAFRSYAAGGSLSRSRSSWAQAPSGRFRAGVAGLTDHRFGRARMSLSISASEARQSRRCGWDRLFGAGSGCSLGHPVWRRSGGRARDAIGYSAPSGEGKGIYLR